MGDMHALSQRCGPNRLVHWSGFGFDVKLQEWLDIIVDAEEGPQTFILFAKDDSSPLAWE
jgi:hypothetical protein